MLNRNNSCFQHEKQIEQDKDRFDGTKKVPGQFDKKKTMMDNPNTLNHPSLKGQNQSMPAIVFDLDETLIFCASVKPSGCSLPLKIGRYKFYVQFRPGLNEFLKEVSKYYDIFFFTASDNEYANKVIDAIWPQTPKSHRFFRDSCKPKNGYLVKDLSLLHKQLSHVILIDDIEGSALLQPRNLVRISPYYGDNNDNVLLNQLLPLLTNSASENDVLDAVITNIRGTSYSELFLSR